MKRAAADIMADARQRLRASSGLETVREDAAIRLSPTDLTRLRLRPPSCMAKSEVTTIG
jgi:hypothetical protein